MKTFEEVRAVLKVLDEMYCGLDGIAITTDNGIDTFATCSDFFVGAADAEPIEPRDIPALEAAHKDCEAALTYSGCMWGLMLWCARKIKMRPMDCQYDHIPPALHALFNACGPVRAMTPDNHPRRKARKAPCENANTGYKPDIRRDEQ